MPTAIHTIGDQALETVLNILDQFPLTPFRDRIIHVQVLRQDLIKRLAEPGRCADIQPRFLAGDYPWVQDRLGDKRMNKARSEEHTSELQSRFDLVCRLLLE